MPVEQACQSVGCRNPGKLVLPVLEFQGKGNVLGKSLQEIFKGGVEKTFLG